jgi:hypothetical protein
VVASCIRIIASRLSGSSTDGYCMQLAEMEPIVLHTSR